MLGDDPSHIFPVKIERTESIGVLKKAIKDEKWPAFDHIPADTLVLWKVSFPVNESLEENLKNGPLEQLLSPVDKLSKVFSDVPDSYLHIVVKPPLHGEST